MTLTNSSASFVCSSVVRWWNIRKKRMQCGFLPASSNGSDGDRRMGESPVGKVAYDCIWSQMRSYDSQMRISFSYVFIWFSLINSYAIIWGKISHKKSYYHVRKELFFSYEIILNHVWSYAITFDHIKSLVIIWEKTNCIWVNLKSGKTM